MLYASIQITREARDGGVSEQTREALHLALAGSVALDKPERLLRGDEFILDTPGDVGGSGS